MRIYKNFPEALKEIKRDLTEMGVLIHTQTMQDKNIGNNPDFETLELQNYQYTVTNMDTYHLLNPTQPWAQKEFAERISRLRFNPGVAWKERKDVWSELLEEDGMFSYTYPDRMAEQLDPIINELKIHPDSRQIFLSVWNPLIDIHRIGRRRVPCTLGYYLQKREGRLNITYLQRSADYITHFQNDIYLAVKFMEYIAQAAGYDLGMFTHWIGSLHIYRKDAKGVF